MKPCDGAPVQTPALLAQLVLELQALRGTVDDLADEQRHLVRRLLAHDDRRVMTRLAPLVEDLLGDQVWTAAALYAAALADDTRGELLHLIADLNSDSGGLRQFGGLLERCGGGVFAGVRLVAIGARDRAGALYQVKRVSRPPKHALRVVAGEKLADDGSAERTTHR